MFAFSFFFLHPLDLPQARFKRTKMRRRVV